MKRLQGVAALLGLLVLAQPANSAELKIFGSRVTKVIVGELGPQFEKATGYTPVVIADSFAAMFGSLIGTSTTTSYIESAAGVSAGGRTGLTAAFVAMFFLLALLFSPLAGMVPAYATAAALLYVACVMTQGLAEIEWGDITEYAPAVVTAVSMPLTYSIATGIGLGFITYVLCKIIAGKFAEARPAVVVLAILFGIKFAITG